MGRAVAAGLAAVALEVLLARTLGDARARAEPGVFALWQPAVLAVLAFVLVRTRQALRMAALVAAVLGGGVAVAVSTGRIDLRGPAAGAVAALIADGVAQAGRTLGGRWLAAGGLILILAVPGAGRLYARLATETGRPAATGLRVAVLAGVPLRWGEAAGLASLRPSAAWDWLADAFVLVPADRVTAAETRWLIVQPRAPGAAGLVAIDAMLRAGGQAVILTDPTLDWPSVRPVGDPAAPPRRETLAPLLAHWGLILVADRPGLAVRDVVRGGRRWRLALPSPGRFMTRGTGPCRISAGGLVADCAVGRGRATLLADADMLEAGAWSDAAGGAAPAYRPSDNIAFVALLLAGQAGRAAPARPVAWTDSTTAHPVVPTATIHS